MPGRRRPPTHSAALFETGCEVFFAFNGTAANALALASLCQVLSQRDLRGLRPCRDRRVRRAGVLLQRLQASDRADRGRQADAGARQGPGRQPPRHPLPAAPRRDDHPADRDPDRSTPLAELRALSAVCRDLGLALHMDGARFANACASLGCSPADMTWRAGVDVLCFGGTKNGMHAGEAVVFLRSHASGGFRLSLQAGGPARLEDALSCRRPGSACWRAAPGLANARHANACATRFSQTVAGIPGVRVLFPVEANACSWRCRPR